MRFGEPTTKGTFLDRKTAPKKGQAATPRFVTKNQTTAEQRRMETYPARSETALPGEP